MTETNTFIRAFSRYAQPIEQNHPILENIQLLSSSSDGNSTWLKNERLLIDLGLTYKSYLNINPNFFKLIDYIILTHQHGDHIHVTTLKKVLANEPHLKILIPIRMYNAINTLEWLTKNKLNPNFFEKFITNNQIIIVSEPLKLTSRSIKDFSFIPHITNHGDITNIAIELKTLSMHMLYATDLSTIYPSHDGFTSGLPIPQFNDLFDIICLEANYNTNILEAYIAEQNRRMILGSDITEIQDAQQQLLRAKSNKRHLSEEESWNYASRYLKPDGIYIPLHASKDFGTLQQITRY